MRYRNVIILSVCTALGFSGPYMVLLLGGIVGSSLAPAPTWATLPIAVMTVGVAVSAVPAALLMRRVGRRVGSILGAATGIIAALVATYAIAAHSFFLFCLAMAGIGANFAFAQQYRFGAAESVEKAFVGRAVSLVLLGALVAGYLGPEIGRRAANLLPYGAYSGSFLVLAMVYVGLAMVLLLLKEQPVQDVGAEGSERPLHTIIGQRGYQLAVWTAAVACGVMGFVMTATPISMHVMDFYNLNDTKVVIQSHLMSMYAPSLITAFLLRRLGAFRPKLVGLASMAACIGLAVLGHGFANYLIGLILMGLGWNLLFVGATVLLTQTYRPAERFHAQAINDLGVFSVLALASVLAGPIISRTSWEVLNLLGLPFLVLTAILILTIRQETAQPT